MHALSTVQYVIMLHAHSFEVPLYNNAISSSSQHGNVLIDMIDLSVFLNINVVYETDDDDINLIPI